jgi:predicted nuclease with TOPRIM domain
LTSYCSCGKQEAIDELTQLRSRIAELESENARLQKQVKILLELSKPMENHSNLANELFKIEADNIRLQKAVDDARSKIEIALKTLPDSEHEDSSWDFAWEELSGNAQDFVKDQPEGDEMIDINLFAIMVFSFLAGMLVQKLNNKERK